MIVKTVLAMTAISCVMVACGGTTTAGTSAPVVGADFATRATAVCKAALAEKAALGPFPYPDFNPTQPDSSKLPGIATFELGVIATLKKHRAALTALGQPPTGLAEWAAFLAAYDHHARVTVAQQAAAERGDARTFAATYDEGRQATRQEVVPSATAAGVPSCAALFQ